MHTRAHTNSPVDIFGQVYVTFRFIVFAVVFILVFLVVTIAAAAEGEINRNERLPAIRFPSVHRHRQLHTA